MTWRCNVRGSGWNVSQCGLSLSLSAGRTDDVHDGRGRYGGGCDRRKSEWAIIDALP